MIDNKVVTMEIYNNANVDLIVFECLSASKLMVDHDSNMSIVL